MRRALLATTLLLCLFAKGQDPKVTITPRPKPARPAEAEGRETTIRTGTSLVLIPVTVTDPYNRFVTGLEKGDFRLFEEKVEQQISVFASEDAPMSMGLVFDTSGSMGPKLRDSRRAVSALMRVASPEDEFFIIQFSNHPELLVDFTNEPGDILSRVTFTKSKGSTALLDAIYMAVSKMKKARNSRKAVVVVSDGGDNSSRYTVSEVNNLVREADVQIYAMGIFEGLRSIGRSVEEMSGPDLMTKICEQTGGRHYAVGNPAEMPDIATKIAIELRNEYVLGFTPKNQEKDGKYRRVKVQLIQPRGMPPLRPHWRHGYYAPLQ